MEVECERENGYARGRHACLLLARPFFLVLCFQAPATQARFSLLPELNSPRTRRRVSFGGAKEEISRTREGRKEEKAPLPLARSPRTACKKNNNINLANY